MTQFVHLRLHTEYSLIDSTIRIKPLMKAVEKTGMPAIAITDQNNFFGLVKFYKAAMGAGIKPIFGADVLLVDEQGTDTLFHLILLCQNNTGYRNLTRLISRAWQHGQVLGVPRVQRAWIRELSDGVIMLSGGRDGDVGQALLSGNQELAEKRLREWLEVFPERYYLELQRTGREGEEDYIHAAVDLALAHDVPVVATNDVRFVAASDFDAHEARVCINSGNVLADPKRPKHYSSQQYLRTATEMVALFADIPSAIANTVEIAKRCNVSLILGKNYLPQFPIPEGMTEAEYFCHVSQKGLEERLDFLLGDQYPRGTPAFAEKRKVYDERLRIELDVINKMGFPGYFLIVADFIQWAKDNGIPVGPGRGSGAGSLVAYALKITDLDPLAYDLLFERFLNPERVSMPDFDIDFCMDNRDKVIDYVARTYGRNQVSQIITFGSMAAKAVVRDVGRVLGHPYGFVDRVAKLIPNVLGVSLSDALGRTEKSKKDAELVSEDLCALYEKDEEVKALMDMALALEGLTRNTGKHAGGVLISPSDLTDFTPIACDDEGNGIVSQYDKDDVEAVGLVKFDFLGLRNLTIIDWALHTINAQNAAKKLPPVDINRIPLEDKASFDLLKAQKTTAVFQLESRGMKDLIRRLQPDVFEDVIALVALFRPGPLQSGMVDDFINRKKGIAKVEYPHPSLEQILKPTYGVIVYQEQVMQIAQVLANYTLGGADMLRRAMGKKKPEEMAKQRSIFMDGARNNQIDESQAGYIFDLMEKFAEYGFNKCVVADTRIMHADTGEMTTVGELFNSRREFVIHALGDDWQLHKRQVVDVMWNGRKPVYELRTRLGKRITATANHPFRTWDGWKHLGDLQIGERIAVPRQLTVQGSNHWQDYELITLAGLLSEGNTCHPSSLYFFNNKREMIDDFAAAIECFSHTCARVTRRSDGRFEVCANTGQNSRFQAGQIPWNARSNAAVATTSLPVRSGAYAWAADLALLGKKATEKSVPDVIFTLPHAQISLFLGRLWSGDGFVANKQLHVPFYATSSKQLAFDVQTLLLRLSIPSCIHTKHFNYRNGQRVGYTVHVLGDGSVETFVERVVPYVICREGQIAELEAHLATTERGQTSKDTIPAEVRQWVAKERAKLGITWTELEQRSGVSMKEFCGKGSHVKQAFRRSTIAKLAVFFSSERLEQVANSDVFWDCVVAIEARGEQDTYDLTVEQDHNFVADGIIVHNSHSAAYALVAFQTAWLKAHHPAAFMAAVLSADMDNTDKVVTLLDDCRQLSLTVLPPDINRSEFQFTVDDKNRIIYGLGALKGAGEAALSVLVEQRRKDGEFKSLADLCKRASSQKVNKRVLETLIKAGAFDSLGGTRRAMLEFLPEALRMAEQYNRDQGTGQTDLFGGMFGGVREDAPESLMPNRPEFPDKERLRLEKETLGLYLTGHPLDEYTDEVKGLPKRRRLADIAEDDGTKYRREPVMLAGLVAGVRTQNTDNGKRAFVQLDDNTAYYEMLVFTDTFNQYGHLLEKEACIVIEGTLDTDQRSGNTRLRVEKIHNMQAVRENYLKKVVLPIEAEQLADGLWEGIRPFLKPAEETKFHVVIDYANAKARAELRLGQNWSIALDDDSLRQLRVTLGKGKLGLVF